jgi:phosphatidylinositol alpha-1,6-mannosyltransferase
MDILLVTQDFPPERGGIQTYMLELARQFLARGHRVRVICPGRRGEPPPLPGLADHVRVGVHSSFLFLPLLRLLPRYLRRNPGITHVLHAQWQCALAESAIPASRRKHRSYCLVHGRELLTSALGPLARPARPRVFRRLHGAFPNSREVARLLAATVSPACPVRLAHPGVDPERFRPVDASFLRKRYGLEGRPVILSLTRMVERKRLRDLILALPEVVRRAPETALVLCGTGPERESLMALARDTGVAGSVIFPGRIPEEELVAHYCLADVFALPSVSSGKDIEGFGIVFLEAGACEVPVVGTLAGGIPDAVADGETGLLVPPRDPTRLAGALTRLIADREASKAMGRRGRQRVLEGFTWAHTAGRILDAMEGGPGDGTF